ncbi:MAG: hypothetical protein ABFS30_14940 [Pseudomonadota bacterium]
MATVASFSIEFTRFLDAEGKPTAHLPKFARDPDNLIRLSPGIEDAEDLLTDLDCAIAAAG